MFLVEISDSKCEVWLNNKSPRTKMAILGIRKYFLLIFLLTTMFESTESQDIDINTDKCASELRNQVVYEGQPADVYCAETTNCKWFYYPTSDAFKNLHKIADESRIIISPYGEFYSVNSTNLRINKATGQPMINSGSESSPDSTAGIYVLQCPNCATAANLITFDDSKSYCDCDPSSQTMSCTIVYAESTTQPSYAHFDWYDSNGDLVFSDDPLADGNPYEYMFAARSELPITSAGSSEYTCRVSFLAPSDFPLKYFSTNAPTFTKSYSITNLMATTTTSTRATTTTATATTTARPTTIVAPTTAPTTTANLPTTAKATTIVPTTTATLLTTTNTPTSTAVPPVSTTVWSSTLTNPSAVAGTTTKITATISSTIAPATAPTTVATVSVATTKLSVSSTNLVTGSIVAATAISNPTTTGGSQPTGPAQTTTATSQSKVTGTSVIISAISASLPVSKATGLTMIISNTTTTAASQPTGPAQTFTPTKPDTMPMTTTTLQSPTITPAIGTAQSAIQTSEIITTGSHSEDHQVTTIGGLLGLAFAIVLISIIAFTCWMYRCSLY